MGILHDGALIFDTSINTLGFKKGILNLKSLAKGGAAAVASIVSAITALDVAGVKYNAQIESYQTAFKVMTGSAEKATQMIGELRKMAAQTPFELRNLAETTQLLVNYGFTADDAISKMSMLGDISQGNAEKMNRITIAYGQMSSANKVLLEDVKQMIEAGFNPLQEISQTTGESMASLYDRISKGTISVDEITAAMERSTSDGGKYFKSMEEQSKTAAGQLSTLKDNWNTFTGALAQSTSDALSKSVLPALNSSLEESTELVSSGALQEIDNFMEDAGMFVADIIPKAVSGLNGILEHLDLIKAAVVSLGTAYASYKIGSSAANTATALDKHLSTIAATLTKYEAAVGKLDTGSKNYEKNLTQLTGKLTTTQLTVGALTGQIERATAKQALLNKAVSFFKSPTGIGLIIAGITALATWFITVAKNSDETSKRIKELNEEMKNLKTSHEEAIKAIDDTASENLAEAETAKVLKKRLYELDEQLKSNTLSEAEAEIVRDDLNQTANKLNEIIPDIIGNIINENGEIDIQRGKVDSLVDSYYDLVKAKAMANAYQDKINQTAKDLIDAREKQKEASETYLKAFEDEVEFIDINGGKTTIFARYKTKSAQNAFDEANETVGKYESEMKKYAEEMVKYEREVDKLMENSAQKTKKTGDDLGNAIVDTGNKVSGTAASTAKKVTNTAEKAAEELEKLREKDFDNLDKSLELGEISEEDYYKKLAMLRDEHFEKGSDEYEDYTHKINLYNKKMAEEAAKTHEEMAEKVREAQSSLEDSLKEGSEGWLRHNATIIKGIGRDGTDVTYHNTSLSDYADENKRLMEYRDAILALKALGNVPDSIFTDISNMSVEEGLSAAKTILEADSTMRSKLFSGRAENDRLASEIAQQLNPLLNKEKLEEAGIYSADAFNAAYISEDEKNKQEFIRILESHFDEVPEAYYGIGEDSASAFGKGFLDCIPSVMAELQDKMLGYINSMADRMSQTLVSRLNTASAGANSYTYNTQYTFNSSRDTTTEQLAAAKNKSALDRLRGNS